MGKGSEETVSYPIHSGYQRGETERGKIIKMF